jgi:hypothetical protein
MSGSHRWQFFRQGGFDQVVLKSADDLRNIGSLDQKLWVALACPTAGLEVDPRTLKLLDVDGDGRVRAPEVIGAVQWMCKVLKDPGALAKREAALPLAGVRTDTPEGKAIADSAQRILSDLGHADRGAIAAADTADTSRIFASTVFNGDGIVPADAAESPAVKQVIEEIIAAFGGETDRSGKPGVSLAKVGAFFGALKDHADWAAAGQAGQPLGNDTAAAAAAFAAVRDKIEDFFTRCRLAAFDARAAEHLARPAGEWVGIAARTLAAGDDAVAAFPLAAVAPGKALPLGEGVNPAWAAKMADFKAKVVSPLLGDRALITAEQWAELSKRFAGYEAWLAGKKGAQVEGLGLARIQALLAGDTRAAIESLIARDEARRADADAIQAVDQAALYYRDLDVFLSNFVNFADFYGRRGPATFQTGTLYLDGRSCELCLPVADVGAHSGVAGLSGAYLAYCTLTRPGASRTIAAAFTNGDADFLRPGRNGIFYDREGRDWDATITKVVEAPISVRQAFWSPYKRISRFVGAQFEKFGSDREKAVEAASADKVGAAAAQVEAPAAAAPTPAATAFDVGKFAGIFAAIGLALGAIGSAVAAVLTGFLGLALWQMPLVIAAVLLLISGPSMLLAWLKLRQRNLAPLLDASGWAINTRARLNVPFGARLTQIAQLPEGASRELADPYAEPKPAWRKWSFLLVIVVAASILWEAGLIKRWLGM